MREQEAINESVHGEAHPDIASSLTLLASALIEQQKFEEAYALAERARVMFSAALPEGHWRTAVAASTEGAALAGLLRYTEAEQLLLDSYTVLTSDAVAIPMFVSQARERLVSLYVAWGKPEKAAEIPTLSRP